MFIVSEPAKIIEELSSKDQTVEEGETVQLICNTTGIPTPTVTWYRRSLRNTEEPAQGAYTYDTCRPYHWCSKPKYFRSQFKTNFSLCLVLWMYLYIRISSEAAWQCRISSTTLYHTQSHYTDASLTDLAPTSNAWRLASKQALSLPNNIGGRLEKVINTLQMILLRFWI